MNQSNKGAWLTTSRAAQALGVHPVTLRRKRDDGYLKHGFHFRKIGDARNSQYVWNINTVLEAFNSWKAPQSSKQTNADNSSHKEGGATHD